MIDTAKLQKAIDLTLKDKSVIHSSVKHVNKAPDYFDICVTMLSTWDNSAQLEIIMAWHVEEFVHVANIMRFDVIGRLDESVPLLQDRAQNGRLTGQNALRLKWFRRVAETLNRWGNGRNLSFDPDYERFEFGIGQGCIWAVLPLTAFELVK